jgi:hypothetical protein
VWTFRYGALVRDDYPREPSTVIKVNAPHFQNPNLNGGRNGQAEPFIAFIDPRSPAYRTRRQPASMFGSSLAKKSFQVEGILRAGKIRMPFAKVGSRIGSTIAVVIIAVAYVMFVIMDRHYDY